MVQDVRDFYFLASGGGANFCSLIELDDLLPVFSSAPFIVNPMIAGIVDQNELLFSVDDRMEELVEACENVTEEAIALGAIQIRRGYWLGLIKSKFV